MKEDNLGIQLFKYMLKYMSTLIIFPIFGNQ